MGEVLEAITTHIRKSGENKSKYDTAPRYIRKVDPEYPKAARRARISCTVEVEFTIGVNGLATDIKIPKPMGFGFDKACIEAVKKWEFVPAKQDGVAVPVRVRQSIAFSVN